MGRESYSTGKKEINGRARHGSIEAGNMIFTYECSRSSKSGLGYMLRYKNNGGGQDLEC